MTFDRIKKTIASAPVLALYDPAKPTTISADNSSYGLGAVLQQQQSDGTWRPVFYASRSLTDVERRYAQLEKECLSLTWACERLSDFIVGIPFQLYTDHKPLVSLLSSKRALDDIPPRIQRMRIRLMRFDYSVHYVAGSQIGTADTLSRFPLNHEPVLVDSADVIEPYISHVVETLPITDVLVDKVLAASASDDVIQRVIAMCTSGWPKTADSLPPEVRPYFHSRDEFTVHKGLLLYGARVVVPSSLRAETLKALHVGHLGVDKCRAKARASIWWPRISADIERHVTSCQTCLHWAGDHAEPLISTPLPELPWQKVATDLFELDGKHYIVVVDYYSRFFEVARLPGQTSEYVIKALREIFARFGCPMVCVSDGGPAYNSSQFEEFTKAYGFIHQMSSPRFAQSNGASERAVQTAKNILRKAEDPQLALLSYRTTPIINGYSPAQLLMGRQLRSNVPTFRSILHPSTPDADAVQQRDNAIKARQTFYFNRRHRAKKGRQWAIGDQVWVPDLKTTATVIDILPFRSYKLRTTSGTTIRRNGRALRHTLPPKPCSTSSSPSPTLAPTQTVTSAPPSTVTSPPSSGRRSRCRIRDDQSTPAQRTSPQAVRRQPAPRKQASRIPSPTVVTQSGRQVRIPVRYRR
jgi:hypothetical protein